VGSLLVGGQEVRRLIIERVRRNLLELQGLVASRPSCSLYRVEGGWSAVIRVPATRPEETLMLELLEHDSVLVHPGYFFDFPHEAFVVVSLLPEPGEFREGAERLVQRASA
jgi:hypothetical protein